MATALITGGTSGIGAAFARQLASEGSDLVLVARDAERLAAVAAELHAAWGINVETMVADLAEAVSVSLVAERIESAERPIDLLINNAGFGLRTPLTSPDVASHEHAFQVMCRAVLVLGGAGGRAMRGRGGIIINMSSLQTYLATGSYAAIKAWVTAYSRSLAVELRGSGVTVTAVLPGWVRTEWHARAGVQRSSLPGFLWSEPEVVARAALRDARRGAVISIPTVRYRVLAWFARHLPDRANLAISARISSSKKGEGSEHPAVKAEKI